MPFSVFDAQLPRGGTVVVMSVQIQTESQVSIVVSGSTWNFRSKLASMGIPGGYVNPESDDNKGPYVRTLKDIDIAVAEEKQRVFTMLSEGVFAELAMRVVVEGEEEVAEDSPAATFVNELRDRSHLHFK